MGISSNCSPFASKIPPKPDMPAAIIHPDRLIEWSDGRRSPPGTTAGNYDGRLTVPKTADSVDTRRI
ncbi:hypothetical protein GWI33_003070 [Rhynchophorus ferrugineus]|uniref:Uncharacterized protein n=1 Tax=Rhynchophorus ferrugineus TaxID=354439 RepID=A0A834INW8_RHYFE|nr:hypothetical protein GWI33_003070 [Rhynchophorus ferrugineus]